MKTLIHGGTIVTEGRTFQGSIVIENDVWIGSNCTLLKGTIIPEGSIVAAGSVISKKVEQEKSIITGSPLKILKTGVSWLK